MSFKDEIDINAFALDKEWLKQPLLFSKYAEKLTEARLREDKAKEAKGVIAAELELEIRTDPEKFGLPKLTEAIVRAAVEKHPEYKGASQAYLQLKYESNMLKQAVDTLCQRKDALENLVKLHLRDYYSDPTPSDQVTKERVNKLKEDIVKNRRQLRRNNNE